MFVTPFVLLDYQSMSISVSWIGWKLVMANVSGHPSIKNTPMALV